MNCVLKMRLLQFAKTINIRNLYHGQNVTLLKPQQCPNFVIAQRGQSTKYNLKYKERKSFKSRDEHETGAFGYFLLSIPITSFCLGTWQIQRHWWKLSLINDLNKRTSSTPVYLPEDLSELESMEYHPVKVRGRFLHDREFTIGPRSLIIKGAGASEGAGGVLTPGRSNSGYCVVTPFEVEGRDLTILVNRGWVPLRYKKDPREARTQTNDVIEITGIVRLNEHRPVFTPKNSPKKQSWLYRDLDAMAEYAGTSPVYIELVAKETVPGGPIAGQTRVNLRNEHLSYIFTWYCLAAITGWLWHRQFVRKLPLV
ncbi:surfeit locus protein 1 [Venturia canescens]|uniref:surfeit locus protein 1 n=1 Tax=Venturia canescens TaxID=32260 RepID=UPI001C9BD416|nr:surfeit locus protein 1 [Venturia canescens]